MTLPHERLRALGWGFELLSELQLDEGVPQAQKLQAMVVLERYPTPPDLDALIQSGADCLAEGHRESLQAALILFHAISCQACSEKTKNSLLYTLRHFPDAWEIKQSCGVPGMTLRQWIDSDK